MVILNAPYVYPRLQETQDILGPSYNLSLERFGSRLHPSPPEARIRELVNPAQADRLSRRHLTYLNNHPINARY